MTKQTNYKNENLQSSISKIEKDQILYQELRDNLMKFNPEGIIGIKFIKIFYINHAKMEILSLSKI